MTEYTASKQVVNKLWQIIGQADKGTSSYWLGEQLRWLAHEIEPPTYWAARNAPLDRVAMGTEDREHD